MDPDKITIKYKKSKNGNAVIAYCEEYPEIQGMGPSEEQATANFWKCFNNKEMSLEREASEKKKLEKQEKKAA